MAKHISTKWKVVANNTDLSSWAFDVQGADEKEKIDVSGFNATGSKEYLPGTRDETVTVQFVNDRASGGPHQTLLSLYQSGTAFKFYVQPDMTAGTDATNPIYGGTASLYSFPFSATLNQREEMTVEFSPAPNSVFEWGTVAP